MTEFEAVDLSTEAPPEICPDCATHGLIHCPMDTALLYCEHRQAGAYRVSGNAWRIIPRISRDEFIRIVTIGATKGELIRDVARGLKVISDNQATRH